jgi:valyl-tRNA synthetase
LVPRGSLLIDADWPTAPAEWIDAQAEAEIGLVIAAFLEGRSVQSELNMPPSARPALLITEDEPAQRAVFQANAAVIAQSLLVSELRFERHPRCPSRWTVPHCPASRPVHRLGAAMDVIRLERFIRSLANRQTAPEMHLIQCCFASTTLGVVEAAVTETE